MGMDNVQRIVDIHGGAGTAKQIVYSINKIVADTVDVNEVKLLLRHVLVKRKNPWIA